MYCNFINNFIDYMLLFVLWMASEHFEKKF